MRVLIFHGYLLGGTGSNVYNARLARALVGLGHEVHLLCQERHPEEHPFVSRAGDWDDGALRLRELATAAASGPGSCTVYRPNIGGLLPVYVLDRYEGIEARTFAACSDAEVDRYIEANVAAVAELRELVRPQLALANHLVMGPVILARGLAQEVPYAVKVHGSALEYTVKPEPERFLAPAREGLGGANGVLVGSRHTALSLWQAVSEDGLEQRTRLGPPGVDVDSFRPRPPGQAAAAVEALAARLAKAGEAAGGPSEGAFARDHRLAGRALESLDPAAEPLVAYVGKLIVSKGVDLLIACWPLVLEHEPRARLVIVGFGAYREGLERLRDTLAAGDLEGAREIARAGRALELQAEEPRPLGHLLAFLDRLEGAARERYLAAARGLLEAVVLTGRLEHEELAELLPACEALVVPSTFPEAFGMVAAEAAACGTFPISAAHSGLAEVSDTLARALPAEVVPLLSFPIDDDAVPAIATRVLGWLGLEESLRDEVRRGLAATARGRWSWEGVAGGVLAAASGQLDGLRAP